MIKFRMLCFSALRGMGEGGEGGKGGKGGEEGRVARHTVLLQRQHFPLKIISPED